RGRHAIAYAKGIDTIAGVLALAGAGRAVLLFEESAVMSATRSRANRLANADHANLVRTSRAAHAQLRAVAQLRRSGELATLPQRLREIAELRERHPTLPLRELALKCRPPKPAGLVMSTAQALSTRPAAGGRRGGNGRRRRAAPHLHSGHG